MKIGIDGLLLTISNPCGTKLYAEQLLTNLAKIDKKNQYLIFASKKVVIPKHDNFQLIKIPSYIPIFKRQFFLASYARRYKVDVFHYLEPYGAVFFHHPNTITTVHDLDLDFTYPKFGNQANLLKRYYYEIARRGVVNSSQTFITDSNSIAKELNLHLISIKKRAKINMIPLAADTRFKVLPNLKNPKNNYFLCMGDFAPRKNILRIIEAYSMLPTRLRATHKLKIITSSNILKKAILEKIALRKDISSFEMLENVSLITLIKLYNKACVFLYPSLYEGFGIPILEAMACGCPVITSNRGAMKETAGNAAYLINPESTQEISKAMKNIAQNSRLFKNLRLKGLKRTRMFSWKKTAKKTLKAYEKTIKK